MSGIKIKCQKGSVPVDGCCIVVEYLPGGTVRSYLSKYTMKKKLPLDTVIQLALDAAKGLSYIHSQKIAHRDVKTENLLMDKTGRVKIIDFGLSTEFFSLGLDYPPMMVGTTGTIGYMAPEVLTDPAYDHKCDVYSFGICLWEMYTCLDPYPEQIPRSKTSHQIYKNRRPEIPTSCPKALSDIMKKCWDVKPQKRPEMKEVVHMLETIQTTKERQQKPTFCFA
ncbi:serine/threonine/tyrosine-protein kinase HT1-like [Lycium ferocissimum]|uniref:serine/threonine/tyrosine-protein kinase HT1-like n=1 Tax=Lycium ferocissimum TaxID=112874 RepID=UPI002815FAFF|nr:serine/threonine/tyrosine-protein kinase HT1-like [Lycium ferocissimum]